MTVHKLNKRQQLSWRRCTSFVMTTHLHPIHPPTRQWSRSPGDKLSRLQNDRIRLSLIVGALWNRHRLHWPWIRKLSKLPFKFTIGSNVEGRSTCWRWSRTIYRCYHDGFKGTTCSTCKQESTCSSKHSLLKGKSLSKSGLNPLECIHFWQSVYQTVVASMHTNTHTCKQTHTAQNPAKILVYT